MGFSPGQIVCLASNPSIRGVVVEVQAGPSEDRIMVFVDGNVQRYYASQLQAVDQSDSVSPYRRPISDLPDRPANTASQFVDAVFTQRGSR